jgi:hypothetical protein
MKNSPILTIKTKLKSLEFELRVWEKMNDEKFVEITKGEITEHKEALETLKYVLDGKKTL